MIRQQIKSISQTLLEFGCKDAVEYYPSLTSAIEYYVDQFKPKKTMIDTKQELIRIHVCDEFGVNSKTVFNKTRKREIVEVRQLIATLYRFGLRMSLASVGINTGKRDHATTLHSVTKVHERYETYGEYRNKVNDIINYLFPLKADQVYIKTRIIDPHKDKRESLTKLQRYL